MFIEKSTPIIILTLGLLLWNPLTSYAADKEVDLEWVPNSEPDLAGYNVYHGTTSGVYGFPDDVQNKTSHHKSNLDPDKQHYFAVTAYDESGNESDPSAEVSTPPPSINQQLSVSITGSGTVASTPTGLNCSSSCSASFAEGQTVTLSATPQTGSSFSNWSGACSGTGSCVVTMSTAKSVTATFVTAAPPPPTTHELSVSITGSGTVASTSTGLNCSSSCSASFAEGQTVTLSATPQTGSSFSNWSGACSGTGSCVVTMSTAKSVTATFVASSPPPSSGTLLSENFGSTSLAGWTVVDEGDKHGPSNWSASTGALTQDSNIHSGSNSGSVLPKLGTFLYYANGFGWTNYQATFTLHSSDNDALGVMFRYQDPNNYYRFSWDQERKYRRLVKVHNGSMSVLAQDSRTYVTGQTYHVDLRVQGSDIKVLIDNSVVLSATDSALVKGTLAFYTWANRGSQFDDLLVKTLGDSTPPPSKTLLSENFSSTSLAGWTVVDEGSTDSPSAWSASTGALIQSSNIYGGSTSGSKTPKPGTFLHYKDGSGWTNYQATFTMRSSDDDAFGIMFRYQNPDNYYRFSWDQQRQYRRLVKVHNGSVSVLAQDSKPYVSGRTYQVDLRVKDGAIEVRIDNTLVLSATDSALGKGSVAFYSWANKGSRFDDLHVTTLEGSDPAQPNDPPTNPSPSFVKVNFQPLQSSLPSGYKKDSGATYSSSQGYGWSTKVNTRERDKLSDQILDTFIHFDSGSSATWTYDLPNGKYLVSLASGDPSWAQGPHHVTVEGQTLINGVRTGRNEFVTVTDAPVTVSDGKLTVVLKRESGTHMILNYIEISPAP